MRRAFVILCAAPFALFSVALLYVLEGRSGSAKLPADCAIVFGAAVHPVKDEEGRVIGSVAGPGIVRRVRTAAALRREGLLKTLYLSGGRGEGMLQSEAAAMRQIALEEGIDPRDLVLEERSTSTRENIRNVLPLTGSCSSVVGISDAYHLARIEFLAWQEGWGLRTIPSRTHATLLHEARSTLREAAGILYYLVF